ncbi:prepilin-type N-terminal cleavage/methylation domain-containing protein [Lysinibacillus capsici]|uniref:prepilin-type N-terminal cleavage/methylation domain-containing protein n=1 Tax=Lysinibacillus capsici TaxID=2115968 RepID=UPI0028A2276D|nr:prepilin-type N-terminal cleavage/methylation domain-containing protein [Lysinibacillus capsici]
MLKKWKNKKLLKNEKGLTLVELLAVIVILAIIAAIAVPAIGNIINKSKDRAILAEASNILAGAKIAYIDGACVDNTCSNDELEDFVDGIALESGDQVVYDESAKEWKITYKRLGDVKLEKFKENIDSNAITEANLNKNLTKAGDKPETDTTKPTS